MDNRQEAIEIEIDAELLEKLKRIALGKGLSPEQYIREIMDRFAEKHKGLSG